ncbi:MAG TPA: hypothetical protein VJ801_18185 [Polyangia bacterium]|jgi:hypothetical protein|nr:hypothetical protein [Polyangia bacterium]
MNARAILRRLIVATSIPPVAGVYRAVYRALVAIAVRRLRRFSSLRAVYLRRGLAKGEGVPGISDIDLAVVGEWDAAGRKDVTESYCRLARLCPLYDQTIGVYTPESIAKLFRTDPFHRHRLTEGRREWRLLFGDDCLSHLEPPTEDDASVGYEAEIKLWWTYFARWAYGVEQTSDRVFLNSLCFKVAAECFRMDCGLRSTPVPESRRQAIEQARTAAGNSDDVAFFTRILESVQRRHLHYRGNAVEDLHSFLLPFLARTYRNLGFHRAWRPLAGVMLRLDSREEEHIHPASVLDQCEALATRARECGWGRIRRISSPAFAMDEVVVLMEPAAGRVPGVGELRAMSRACAETLLPLRSRVGLFLSLSSVAYQIYASDALRGWQAILSPGANPDVFLPRGDTSAWTAPAAGFVRQERLLLTEALDDPVVYKANDLDFLRMVWKLLELVVVEHSAARGEVILAQTPEAVLRGLDRLGLPRPPHLELFASAYRSELAGSPSNVGKWIPATIDYLRTICREL